MGFNCLVHHVLMKFCDRLLFTYLSSGVLVIFIGFEIGSHLGLTLILVGMLT